MCVIKVTIIQPHRVKFGKLRSSNTGDYEVRMCIFATNWSQLALDLHSSHWHFETDYSITMAMGVLQRG